KIKRILHQIKTDQFDDIEKIKMDLKKSFDDASLQGFIMLADKYSTTETEGLLPLLAYLEYFTNDIAQYAPTNDVKYDASKHIQKKAEQNIDQFLQELKQQPEFLKDYIDQYSKRITIPRYFIALWVMTTL